MTTINVQGITAPDVSNLTATDGIKSVVLDWDLNGQAVKGVEVWRSDDNDRSNATKIITVWQESYVDVTVTAGDTYYYWILAKSIYDRTDGDWEPVGSTNGVSGTANEVSIDETTFDSENLTNGGGQQYYMKTGSGSSSGSSIRTAIISGGTFTYNDDGGYASSFDITAWDTWTDIIYTRTYNYTGTWYGFIGTVLIDLDWGTPSGTTGQVELLGRVIVYNDTDSTNEFDGVPFSLVKLEYDYSKTYWTTRNYKYQLFNTSSSALNTSKYYQMKMQLKKTRTNSGSSWTPKWVNSGINFEIDFGWAI